MKHNRKSRSAVIFDFDGVVIDSLQVQRKAFNDSYRLVADGPLPSFEEYLSHSGDSLANILTRMNLPLDMIEPYRHISRSSLHLVEVIAGMQELLDGISQQDWKCGLCTGKDRIRTLEVLDHFDLARYFDTVTCSDDVMHPKPHPESLLLAIEQLGATVEQTVFVGDGTNDILCARAAGVTSIAVSWGHNSAEALLKELPDHMAYSVNELHTLIHTFLTGFINTPTSRERNMSIGR